MFPQAYYTRVLSSGAAEYVYHGTHLFGVVLRLKDIRPDPPNRVLPRLALAGRWAAPVDAHHLGTHEKGRLAHVLAHETVAAKDNNLSHIGDGGGGGDGPRDTGQRRG